MTRVVHLTTVHHAFDPRIFHRECRSLVGAGYDLHLVAPHVRDERRSGVHVHALPAGGARRSRARLQRPAFEVAARLGGDVYHIHDPELIPVLYALKQTTGARAVYDMHEDYAGRGGMEGSTLRAAERWCFRWVDHVILSDAAYSVRTANRRAPATVVANFFRRPEEIKPSPAEESGIRTAVYTGVVSRERGLDHLVALARAIKCGGLAWRVRLAGVCHVRRDLVWARDQMERYGLHDVLQWDGRGEYVPWERLQAHHRTADVGLVLMHPTPNYRNCLPTKFYEYLHAGLPVICSDIPLWGEFIRAHGCGVAVAPHDVDAIADWLRRWEEHALREPVAAAARAAAARFRWSVMEQRLLAVYGRLAS